MVRFTKNGTVKNMTREEYLSELLKAYRLVSVLSDKNGCRVMRMRNKALARDIVVRSFPDPVHTYDELYQIRCKNLPLVYDSVILEDGQIVLEEFIDGITVAEVMESGKYKYRGAKKVLCSVCNALSVLHQKNIVHRDVKPENIIIDKNGRVVLIDFNASRKISANTRDTVIMGTAGYVSPEQLGVTQSDNRTDIYALGILLNVMLTGKHPSETLVTGRSRNIVKKCTDINPDGRYSDVGKFYKAL